MNFLKETKVAIKESGHNIKDVMFIGSSNGKYRMNWEEFINNANFEYDDGYGSPEIATDLIIYFKDHTYIRRNEYDGSEWWEYNVPKLFNENDDYKKFRKLGRPFKCGWKTVKEINELINED